MLTHLRLENFKAWEDSGDIRLAPLTVLFGTNSAGKSSIPQLLLILKQTAASPNRQRALQLGDGRALVDAGTFDDVVHAHELGRPLELALRWSLDEELCVSDPLHGRTYAGTDLEFAASIVAGERHQPRVARFRYALREKDELRLDLAVEERLGEEAPCKQPEYVLSSSRYELVRRPGRDGSLPPPLRFYGFPDEVAAYYQNAAFASDLALKLERLLASIHYVGPLRESPRRLYLWSGEVPDHVGTQGEHAVEAILAAGERGFDWEPNQRAMRLPELVAARLQGMGLIHDFRVAPLAEHRKEHEVLVRTYPKAPEVKLTDVGFGVSQVLPVIVECFYVPRRSIVIFEQPEVHLHPRVQAELADLFVDAIRAREDGVSRDCQFIVESHSEHFLRRLQRRIAEEELSHDDAALYFVHGIDGPARIEQLDVDRFGNVRNWPEGFFGDEMEDLVARSEAQARRMSRREEDR